MFCVLNVYLLLVSFVLVRSLCLNNSNCYIFTFTVLLFHSRCTTKCLISGSHISTNMRLESKFSRKLETQLFHVTYSMYICMTLIVPPAFPLIS